MIIWSKVCRRHKLWSVSHTSSFTRRTFSVAVVNSLQHIYGVTLSYSRHTHSLFPSLVLPHSQAHVCTHTIKAHTHKRGGSRAVAGEKWESLHGCWPRILAALAGRARNEPVERSSVIRILFPHHHRASAHCVRVSECVWEAETRDSANVCKACIFLHVGFI